MSFKCNIDDDIETFLQEKAIPFVDKKICSVYLILDQEKFRNRRIEIEGYFTLSLSAVVFSNETSKSSIQRITGYRDRIAHEFILLGQIGKYISGDIKSNISLGEILQLAYNVIQEINEYIPCNTALVECSEAIMEKQLYDKQGFKLFQFDRGLYQYYKILEYK